MDGVWLQRHDNEPEASQHCRSAAKGHVERLPLLDEDVIGPEHLPIQVKNHSQPGTRSLGGKACPGASYEPKSIRRGTTWGTSPACA